MDSQIKNIEIHMVEKIQTQLAEVAADLYPAIVKLAEGLVSMEKLDPGEGQNSKQPVVAEEVSADEANKRFGFSEKSEVLRDNDSGRSYEKLLQDGKTNENQSKSDRILSILDELKQSLPTTLSVTTQPQAAFVKYAEVDSETLLEDFREEEADEEDQQDQSFSEEQEDDENTSEENLTSLKDVQPAFYKSVLTKI